MNQAKHNSGSFIQRVGRVIRAAADRIHPGSVNRWPTVESVPAWPLGIADTGTRLASRQSPLWYQTDLAVYLLRYEHGWGKAAAEMELQPGRLVPLANTEVQSAARRAA